jgi:REP element-mobilizing transposase RayT
MTKPRSQQISLADTPYYHCVSRCVRRAYLCGKDKHSGKSYEHRREWVESRIQLLTQVYAIDVCAYAVMSNHTHLVLHVDLEKVKAWSKIEVIKRWHQLHSGTLLTHRFIACSESLNPFELNTLYQTVEIYRQRLCDISWFMRDLNEVVARQANKEDECTGRFWEGRFKCQALLGEAALLAAMAYVDLNPIRAKMASTPETSAHTSVFHRIEHLKQSKQPAYLLPFIGNSRKNIPKGLPFELDNYLQLVEMSGRAQHPNKRGKIEDNQFPLLNRLGINEQQWINLTSNLEKRFKGPIGNPNQLRVFQQHTGYKRHFGINNATKWISTG